MPALARHSADIYTRGQSSSHLQYPVKSLQKLFTEAGRELDLTLTFHVCAFGSVSYRPDPGYSALFYRFSTVTRDYVLIDYKRAFLRGMCEYLGIEMPDIDFKTPAYKRVAYAYLSSGSVIDEAIFAEMADKLIPVMQTMARVYATLLGNARNGLVEYATFSLDVLRLRYRHLLYLPFSLQFCDHLQTLHLQGVPFFYVRNDSVLIHPEDFEKVKILMDIDESEVHIKHIPAGLSIFE